MPIVRTVATVMAGVGRMRFSLYALYSTIGGIVWADGVLLLGHQLGKVKFVRDHKGYIDYLVIVVVVARLCSRSSCTTWRRPPRPQARQLGVQLQAWLHRRRRRVDVDAEERRVQVALVLVDAGP